MCVVVLPYEPITTLFLAGCGNSRFFSGGRRLLLCVHLARRRRQGYSLRREHWPRHRHVSRQRRAGSVTFALPGPSRRRVRPFSRLDAAPDSLWRRANSPLPISRPRTRLTLPFIIIAMLLLFTMVVRSFVGFAGAHGGGENSDAWFPQAVLVIAGAQFAGKAVGGILADRFGWIGVSVGAVIWRRSLPLPRRISCRRCGYVHLSNDDASHSRCFEQPVPSTAGFCLRLRFPGSLPARCLSFFCPPGRRCLASLSNCRSSSNQPKRCTPPVFLCLSSARQRRLRCCAPSAGEGDASTP